MAIIGPALVHNATFFHDIYFFDVVDAEQSLFRELEEVINPIIFDPTGCNELESRVNSIKERMRFQMSIGFVLGKCIRMVAEKIATSAECLGHRAISLRDCLSSQLRDLQAADLIMRDHCS